MDYEIISDDEVVAVKRGRKSTVDPKLVETLKSAPSGSYIRATGLKCDPKSDKYRSDKATKSAQIRTAGKSAGVEVSVIWSPDGVPQIKIKGATKSSKSGK